MCNEEVVRPRICYYDKELRLFQHASRATATPIIDTKNPRTQSTIQTRDYVDTFSIPLWA